ncbi:TlpA family protein disulfide reductase [Urechidicola croceus]|uniref:Thioredoxin domain-containing protein n=1 Tax=Urechidicola croceus TaxID=1850246 RepID=A0A1D8P400_9FLAO|nr:hypothetical protein [Urechidicola croceus]AOW19295.1 hypothetical protein LPB138_00725 [Urechidicola croceus]
MKNLIKIVLIALTIVSCKSTDSSNSTTYFGGQIINPKGKYIILMKGDKELDTIPLDSKNTFLTKLDFITEEGLYSFKHGLEYQYVYFEPNDSILIRLNTWDFDESLVYSGVGAEKNNFLINLYLQNEKDERSFSPYYNLKSDEFESKINSIQKLNMHLYNQLKNSGTKITEKFDKLAKVAVNYPLNRRKEIYPQIHKNRFQLENYPNLSDTYYDFRKDINLNNEDLLDFAPYNNYVTSYLYSLAYHEKTKNKKFTENLLNIIIDNIKIESFKNNLLHQAIYNDFRETQSSCAVNKTALKIFNEHCTNKKYVDQINNLAKDCESIKQKNPIDNFELLTLNNTKTNIRSIIKNNNSVIYFWSPEMLSPEMLIKRIKKLEKQYPTLLFVGINMHPNESGSRVNQYLQNQYLLTKESSANRFITSLEPRTILVNKKGIIHNSFTYLSSPHLENQLTKLEKN